MSTRQGYSTLKWNELNPLAQQWLLDNKAFNYDTSSDVDPNHYTNSSFYVYDNGMPIDRNDPYVQEWINLGMPQEEYTSTLKENEENHLMNGPTITTNKTASELSQEIERRQNNYETRDANLAAIDKQIHKGFGPGAQSKFWFDMAVKYPMLTYAMMTNPIGTVSAIGGADVGGGIFDNIWQNAFGGNTFTHDLSSYLQNNWGWNEEWSDETAMLLNPGTTAGGGFGYKLYPKQTPLTYNSELSFDNNFVNNLKTIASDFSSNARQAWNLDGTVYATLLGFTPGRKMKSDRKFLENDAIAGYNRTEMAKAVKEFIENPNFATEYPGLYREYITNPDFAQIVNDMTEGNFTSRLTDTGRLKVTPEDVIKVHMQEMGNTSSNPNLQGYRGYAPPSTKGESGSVPPGNAYFSDDPRLATAKYGYVDIPEYRSAFDVLYENGAIPEQTYDKLNILIDAVEKAIDAIGGYRKPSGKEGVVGGRLKPERVVNPETGKLISVESSNGGSQGGRLQYGQLDYNNPIYQDLGLIDPKLKGVSLEQAFSEINNKIAYFDDLINYDILGAHNQKFYYQQSPKNTVNIHGYEWGGRPHEIVIFPFGKPVRSNWTWNKTYKTIDNLQRFMAKPEFLNTIQYSEKQPFFNFHNVIDHGFFDPNFRSLVSTADVFYKKRGGKLIPKVRKYGK